MVQIWEEKKRFLPLLLLGDEQESMIDRYLEQGDLYVLQDGGKALAVCVVTCPAIGVAEIKNLAVEPCHQRQGYGRRLVEFVRQTIGPAATRCWWGRGTVRSPSPFTRPVASRSPTGCKTSF